ncbi:MULTISPECIES: replication/maintenance protein RepL [Pseudomonadota]|nr:MULTISPECIES: replication/maintenance protein RepL [Pseudomonadota]
MQRSKYLDKLSKYLDHLLESTALLRTKNTILKLDSKGNPFCVDTESGEANLDGFPAWLQRKKRPFPDKYINVFDRGFYALAKMNLTGKQCSVLFLLMTQLNYENWLIISQKQIAEELNIAPRNVSTLLKTLVEKGVLERKTNLKGMTVYRLNPLIAWRGDTHSYYNSMAQSQPTALFVSDNKVEYEPTSDAE